MGKWTTTGVQENLKLCALTFPECVTPSYKLKIVVAQAWTREEANQCVHHPGESVRDTLQKPACPAVDPRVQLGSMIYSGCTGKWLKHAPDAEAQASDQGLVGLLRNGGEAHIRFQTWNPMNRLDCGRERQRTAVLKNMCKRTKHRWNEKRFGNRCIANTTQVKMHCKKRKWQCNRFQDIMKGWSA